MSGSSLPLIAELQRHREAISREIEQRLNETATLRKRHEALTTAISVLRSDAGELTVEVPSAPSAAGDVQPKQPALPPAPTPNTHGEHRTYRHWTPVENDALRDLVLEFCSALKPNAEFTIREVIVHVQHKLKLPHMAVLSLTSLRNKISPLLRDLAKLLVKRHGRYQLL